VWRVADHHRFSFDGEIYKTEFWTTFGVEPRDSSHPIIVIETWDRGLAHMVELWMESNNVVPTYTGSGLLPKIKGNEGEYINLVTCEKYKISHVWLNITEEQYEELFEPVS
jgi:hypothetical protein